ncbi:MAG: L,D-transpeptidase family protein [Puia sp.]|nr:L,D-transpeptidase family protein [Puia sp.]
MTPPFGNFRALASFVLASSLCWLFPAATGCRDHPQKPDDRPAASTANPPGNTYQNRAAQAEGPQQQDASIPGNFSPQEVIRFDSSLIPLFIRRFPVFGPLQKDLQRFYAGRSYAYAWYDKKGVIEQADNLFNRVMNITDEGIPDKIPYKDTLAALMNEFTGPPENSPGDTRITGNGYTEKELMLTAQYFNYAGLAWQGLPENKTRSMNWFLPRKRLDLPALMDSLLRDTSSALIRYGYSYRQYNLLRSYLKKYRELETPGNWPSFSSARKSYKPGDTAGSIRTIRDRLFLLGDLAGNSGSTLYDPDLEEGVKNYQERTGMKTDGILGPATLRDINTPLTDRIRQLIVNMERYRWVPVSLNDDYLIVNIPAFHLFAFQKDSLIFTMKAVVGRDVHETVIFNGNLKYIVFSPYWNIPTGILKKEVLPAIKRDPAYLKKHNMEWNGQTIRQKPGSGNPLGSVKFLFPNSHDIYLHDTPAKGLFEETDRAFSHGCIRLAEAEKLALYLLRDEPQWSAEKISAAMKKGREQYVTLKKQVPVFIAYFTAWVDRNGKLNLRKDLYKRDARLAALVAN